jgi:hypothetical protein
MPAGAATWESSRGLGWLACRASVGVQQESPHCCSRAAVQQCSPSTSSRRAGDGRQHHSLQRVIAGGYWKQSQQGSTARLAENAEAQRRN